MHFFRELPGFLFCDLGKEGEGSGIKDTGHYGRDRRRYHETHHRLKISQHRHPHHAVAAPGCEQPPETGSRQHGTAGTEAPAPCGCGAGDEGKAGNPESRCGAGKRGAGKGGDHPGAVRWAAAGDHRDRGTAEKPRTAGEPVSGGGAEDRRRG